MRLSGSDKENLFNALLDAYRTYDELRRLVTFRLEESLSKISSQNANQESVVLDLIEWAERQGRLSDLIWEACEYNNGNENIKNFAYQKYKIYTNQWQILCEILSSIRNFYLVKKVLIDTFEPKNLHSIDPTLTKIEKKSNFSEKIDGIEIKSILKKNLIKKRELSKENKPVFLKFCYCLSRIDNLKISSEARNRLEALLTEMAGQFNANLENFEELFQAQDPDFELPIQPYLLIVIEPKGSNKFNLQAELILQESNSDKNLKKIRLSSEHGCLKEAIPKTIESFINVSNLKVLRMPHESLIIELFLPNKYLIENIENPIERIPITIDKIDETEERWMSYEYGLIIRSLDRLLNLENDSLGKLYRKWGHLINFIESSTTITNKFEYISCCEKDFKWLNLEQKLEREKKIGLNLCSPLAKIQEKHKFFQTIITGGLPLAIWIRDGSFENNDLKTQFEEILTLENLESLENLSKNIKYLRQNAFAQEENAQNHLGYHLGILFDNPKRLPSNFQAYLVEPGV